MVLLPEEYYRPLNLEMRVSSPCELNGDQKHCAHFAYPSLKQDGFVTVQAEEISVVGGIRRNRRVTDIPFQGLILSGSRVSGSLIERCSMSSCVSVHAARRYINENQLSSWPSVTGCIEKQQQNRCIEWGGRFIPLIDSYFILSSLHHCYSYHWRNVFSNFFLRCSAS